MSEVTIAIHPSLALARLDRDEMVAAAQAMERVFAAIHGVRPEPPSEEVFRVVVTDDGFAVVYDDPSLP